MISGQATVIAPTERIERQRGTLPQVRVSLQHGDELVRLLQYVKPLGRLKMAVVHPCDTVSLSAALDARAAGLIEPVLIAPRAPWRPWRSRPTQARRPAHRGRAAQRSGRRARRGACASRRSRGAWGSLHTDELMGAVVSALRTGRRMSHCFIMQTPAYPRPSSSRMPRSTSRRRCR